MGFCGGLAATRGGEGRAGGAVGDELVVEGIRSRGGGEEYRRGWRAFLEKIESGTRREEEGECS